MTDKIYNFAVNNEGYFTIIITIISASITFGGFYVLALIARAVFN